VQLTSRHLDELRALLGPEGVLATDAALLTYEMDALTLERETPEVVVLPRTTDEVAAVVRWARAQGLAVTPRGAGTGLAGGATPLKRGVVLSVNRMDRVLRLDAERMFAWVQPGVVNLDFTKQAAAHGLSFAPDPSSEPVSTIGGNVSTNAGGPHCLKYGVTLNHVLGLVVVLHDGTSVQLGGEAPDSPDFDLASLLVGSEGTLGIVTEVCVRLIPLPETVRTMLLDFEALEDSCKAVSGVIAAGIVPAAMEIIDNYCVRLVEDWLHMGLPRDAGGVLLIEVDGPAAGLDEQVQRVIEIAERHGARTVRLAADETERALFWKARKGAFGAFGRSGRGFYLMDGVVPRTRLAAALTAVHAIARERGLDAGNVFHAGDGNLHPHVLFDASDPVEQEKALDAIHEILRWCIAAGGTISGEHGVGIEKRSMMSDLFAPTDLAVMGRVRDALNPGGLLNPCKILPGGAGCREATAFHARPMRVPSMRADAEGPWI
jgi:glycolate oxidase